MEEIGYLLSNCLITISISFISVAIERPIDRRIAIGRHNHTLTFIKYKHYFYNAPRMAIWLTMCIPFFKHYDTREAVLFSILHFTSQAFLFRYFHDSFYQLVVSKELGIGKGWKQDKIETVYEGRSFTDTIFRDTYKNRKICLLIWALLTLIEVIF